MATPDMDVIKEIPGYKVILKAVLKSQIQQLVEQLATTTDEESVILTASVADGTLCHLGSDSGKVFLEDHEDIKSQFLGFCLKRHHKKKQEKERQEAQEREEAMARLMAPVTPPGYGVPRPGFMPQRSPRHPSPQRGLHPVALSRASPAGRMRSPRHQPYPMTRPTRVPLNFEHQGQVSGPGPRPGQKLDGQVIKIEPDDDDDDEKSNQSVNDSANVQTQSAPESSEPSSPSAKPATPSQSQGPSASDNDDAKSESSSSTIPNEASDLKFSDTAPPEGLSLDSDLSNIISASTSMTDSSVQQSSTAQDTKTETQTSSDLDPNVSVKLEALTESEMDLEITGVELGQRPVQEPMSSQEWMANVQNVMQGASGSAADMSGQQGYTILQGNGVGGPYGNASVKVTNRIYRRDKVPHGIGEFMSSTDSSACNIAQAVERFRCKLCNKINGTKAALERHMVTHTGEKKHVCQFCGKAFTISSSKFRHIRIMHDPNFKAK